MKIEINGRIVEVDDSFANLSADDQQKTVEEIAASINPTKQKSEAGLAMQMAAPAVTGVAIAAPVPSMSTVYQQGVKPVMNAIPSAASAYMREPMKAAVDIGAMALGSPVPPMGTIEAGKGIKAGIDAGRQVVSNIGEALGRLPANTEKLAAPFINSLNQVDQGRLMRAINEQGLEKAIKSFQSPSYFNPAAIESLQATQAAFPSTMQKVGRAIAPVLGAAGRVAGPAGLAYDVYEASKFAREQGLGEQLAAGAGKRAPQAFRGMLNQNISGYQPSAQEAQNLLSSGDARTMNIYGGPDKLNEIIRREAARRVLAGPVAPGNM